MRTIKLTKKNSYSSLFRLIILAIISTVSCISVSAQDMAADFCNGALSSKVTAKKDFVKRISFSGGVEPFASTMLKDSTKVYFDLTATDTLYAYPGQTITPDMEFTGYNAPFRNTAIYIDYGHAGTFYDYPDVVVDETVQNQLYLRYNIDTQTGIPAVGSRLVSYSYTNHYNSGTIDSDKGRNSLGEIVSSADYTSAQNYKAVKPPCFTIPDTLSSGFYRLRFKIDHNRAFLPCGRPETASGGLVYTGGRIIDIVLCVKQGYRINVAVGIPDRGVAYIGKEGVVSKSVVPGEEVTVVAKNNRGYIFDRWEVSGHLDNRESSYTFVPTKDETFTARFDDADTITVSVTVPQEQSTDCFADYSVKGSSQKTPVYSGDTIIFNAYSTNPLQTFHSWTTISGVFVSTQSRLERVCLSSVQVVANFVLVGDEPILSPAGNTPSTSYTVNKLNVKASWFDSGMKMYYTFQDRDPDILHDPVYDKETGITIYALKDTVITLRSVLIGDESASRIVTNTYYFRTFTDTITAVTVDPAVVSGNPLNHYYVQRCTNSVSFKEGDNVIFTSSDINPLGGYVGRPVYHDLRDQFVNVTAGAAITPVIDHYDGVPPTGNPYLMHGFVWIDYDGNNRFENKGNNYGYMGLADGEIGTTDGNEIVTYSAHCGKEVSAGATAWYNSRGNRISGSQFFVPLSAIPSFTVPISAVGIYHIRVNVDFASLNPDGKRIIQGTTYSIMENNGDIMDYTLRVFGNPIELAAEPGTESAFVLTADEAGCIRINGDNSTITEVVPGTEYNFTAIADASGKITVDATCRIIRVNCLDTKVADTPYEYVTKLGVHRTDDYIHSENFPNLKTLGLNVGTQIESSEICIYGELNSVDLTIIREIKTPQRQTVNGVSYTPSVFNFMSVPFDFSTADIEYYDEAASSWLHAVPEQHIRIQIWNGKNRAEQKYTNVWQTIPAGITYSVKANTGFVIVGSNKYGNVTGHTMKLRFSSIPYADVKYSQDPNTVKFVTANTHRNEGGVTLADDADWNFISNPFLESFNMKRYTIYKYSTTVPGAYQYIPYVPAQNPQIMPYEGFLLQLSDGTLEKDTVKIPFDPQTKVVNSAAPITAAYRSESIAQYTLSLDKSTSAVLIINQESVDDYRTNEDAMYLSAISKNQCGVYFIKRDKNVQISVQPDFNKEESVGIYTGAGTSHTLSAPQTEGVSMMLTDNVTGTITNISKEDYTFTAAANTTINNRFKLSIVKDTEITSDKQTVSDELKSVFVSLNDGGFRLNNLPQNCDVEVYDSMGVIRFAAKSNGGTMFIPAEDNGVYLFSITNADGRISLKALKK